MDKPLDKPGDAENGYAKTAKTRWERVLAGENDW
jgi:hypothetical protein